MGVDVVGLYGGRLVTKSNTAGQSLVTVQCSVPNGGTSAWTQVIASTSADTLIVGVGLYVTTTSGSAPVPAQVDVAYGGSGSETLLASAFIFHGSPSAGSAPGGWAALPVLQRIAPGQRVAVRGTQLTGWGNSYTFAVYLATVPVSALENS